MAHEWVWPTSPTKPELDDLKKDRENDLSYPAPAYTPGGSATNPADWQKWRDEQAWIAERENRIGHVAERLEAVKDQAKDGFDIGKEKDRARYDFDRSR